MKKCLVVILALLVASCEKEIDIEIPSSAGQPVMNALIKNGQSEFSIHIHESSAFSSSQGPSTISTAQVAYQLNGSPWQASDLCDTSLGQPLHHYCVGETVTTGQVLKLRAQYGSKDQLFAQTIVPAQPVVNDLRYSNEELTFLIQIDPLKTEYYTIDIIDSITYYDDNFQPYTVVQSQQISSKDPSLELLGVSNDLIDLPIDDPVGSIAFLNTRNLKANQRQINLELQGFSAFDPGGNSPFYLRVRKCSFDYYEYERTKLLNRMAEDNPFAPPVQYHSNVQNGLGVVAAFAEYLIQLN